MEDIGTLLIYENLTIGRKCLIIIVKNYFWSSKAVDTKDELKSHMVTIVAKQIVAVFQEWFDALVAEYPLDEYDWGRCADTDIYLPFKYRGYKLEACLTIDDCDNRLRWGVNCSDKDIPNKWYKELHRKVQVYLPKAQSSEMCPAWDYTSFENGLTRFKPSWRVCFPLRMKNR